MRTTTELQRQEAVRLYVEEERAAIDIAPRYGVGPDQIREWVKQAGYKLRMKKGVRTPTLLQLLKGK